MHSAIQILSTLDVPYSEDTEEIKLSMIYIP